MYGAQEVPAFPEMSRPRCLRILCFGLLFLLEHSGTVLSVVLRMVLECAMPNELA